MYLIASEAIRNVQGRELSVNWEKQAAGIRQQGEGDRTSMKEGEKGTLLTRLNYFSALFRALEIAEVEEVGRVEDRLNRP